MEDLEGRIGHCEKKFGCCRHYCKVCHLYVALDSSRYVGIIFINSEPSDILRLEPNSPEVLILRATILFLSAKSVSALQHVSSALRLDPSYEPAQKLRKRIKDVDRLKDEGNVAFKGGRLQDAIDKYTEALEVSRFAYFFDTGCVLKRTYPSYRGLAKAKKRVKVDRSGL